MANKQWHGPRSLGALLLVMTLGAAGPSGAQESRETLTNDAVITLVKAGLGSQAIIAKIKSSVPRFDISIDALVKLKAANVRDDIIEAMVASSTGAGAGTAVPGNEVEMFLVDASGSTKPLSPSVARHRMAFSIWSFGTQFVVPGRNAAIETAEPRPTFELRFGNDGDTPTQYILARFDESDEGDGRRLELDDAIRLESEKIGPRVYRVRPVKDLKRGEYGFYLAEAAKEGWPGQQQAGIRVYDFSVLDTRRK